MRFYVAAFTIVFLAAVLFFLLRGTTTVPAPNVEEQKEPVATKEAPKPEKRWKWAPSTKAESRKLVEQKTKRASPNPKGLVSLVRADKGSCVVGSTARCVKMEPDVGACDTGDGEACLRSAKEMEENNPRDWSVSRAFYRLACKQGVADACTKLDEVKRTFEAVATDPTKHDEAVHRCEEGDAVACHALVKHHRYDRDDTMVKKVYKNLCIIGYDRQGCFSYALELSDDEPEQTRWAYQEACNMGSPDGCHGLAQHFLGFGLGVYGDSDLERANKTYARCCELSPEHKACEEWIEVQKHGGYPAKD